MPSSDPERALALSYAPQVARPALSALFALDERLGAIVAKAKEPTIGLIRLAWWREALARLDAASAPAEPLLAALAAEVLPRGVSGAMLAEIEDGWAALLDGPPDAEALARHGRARGGALFGAAASVLGAQDARVARAGAGWALADLGHRNSDGAIRKEARAQAHPLLAGANGGWPGALRPLAGLTALARRDASREVRHQGSPARVARLLVSQVDRPIGCAPDREAVMWRYLVGAVAALLLAGGGMLWWRSGAAAERGLPGVPVQSSTADATLDTPEPPTATEKTREERRFARYDKDKDGKILRAEYLEPRRKAFAKLDTNGDGTLSFDEWAIKATTKFAGADKDHDGALVAAEFATTKVARKAKPAVNCPPPARDAEEGA